MNFIKKCISFLAVSFFLLSCPSIATEDDGNDNNVIATKWRLRIDGSDENYLSIDYTINNRILDEEIDREIAENQEEQTQVTGWLTAIGDGNPGLTGKNTPHQLGNRYKRRGKYLLDQKKPILFTPVLQFLGNKTVALDSFRNGFPPLYSQVNIHYRGPTEDMITFSIPVPDDGFHEHTPFTTINAPHNVIIKYWGEKINFL